MPIVLVNHSQCADVGNVYIRRHVGKNHQPKYTIVISSFVRPSARNQISVIPPFLRKSTLKHGFFSSPSQKYPALTATLSPPLWLILCPRKDHASLKIWHPPQKSLVSHRQHQLDQQAHNGGKTEGEGVKVDLVVLKKESI